MKKNRGTNKKVRKKWVLRISMISFFLAIGVGIVSEISIKNLNIFGAFVVLLFIVFLGVVFDGIGIAVAASNPRPFNAMAAKKVKGAKKAVELSLNADRVSNFCNDVIGDIAGIISGAAIAAIAIKMVLWDYSLYNMSLVAVLLSGLTAALTIGGKALGKKIALTHWKTIVYYFALVLWTVENWLPMMKNDR
jgi:CBS domain containing-hemolysin-like protein